MAKNEVKHFLEQYPETSQIDVMIIDLCGNAIGKRLPVSSLRSLYRHGSPVCGAMQLVDVLGNTADPMGYGFSDGDPDAFARPVENTLVPVPWLPGGHAQVLCQLYDSTNGEALWYEPRQVLRRVVERFDELGVSPVVALELEFYFLDRERSTGGEPLAVRSPRSSSRESQGKVLSLDKLDEYGEILAKIQDACHLQGVPATSMISEYGAGQFEVNLAHQPDPLDAADHAALLRRIVQSVSRANSLDATFMSKPFPGQSGSGLHVHLSLAGESGDNLFALENGESLLGHAVAGLQATMAESMAIFAPNLNVYRRFKPDEFVPVTKDWGENNRSVAFRLPPADAANRRLEHRVAGAEANPYLVLAAVLAGVHHGLDNKLDPGEKHGGNAGAETDPALPLTLWQALDRLRQSSILPRYLGERYPQIYAEVKQAEFDAFMEQPSEREFQWYL